MHVYLPMAVHPDPNIGPSSFDLRLNALISRKRELSQNMLAPAEGSESDLGDLFDEVVGGTGSGRSEFSSSSTPSDSDPSTEQSLDRSRNVRWNIASGQLRPLDEILAPFKGAQIKRIFIRDPFALSRDSRVHQAKFIREMRSRTAGIDSVAIRYRAANPNNSDESDEDQCKAMRARLVEAFDNKPPHIALESHSRRDGDIHDRWVDIDVAEPDGTVKSHRLQIGRGLSGLMNNHFECNVAYIPPGT